MNFIPQVLTERQIKRYTKKGNLDEMLKQVEKSNDYEKRVIYNMINITDD